MVINWTKSAINDLKDFIKISMKSKPLDYIKNLISSTKILESNPYAGKIYTYTNKYIVWQFIYKEHRIFYYIDNDIISIITVVHHKQNIKEKIEYIKKSLK